MTEIYSKDLLKDQVALVTGASRGIGASIAQRLSSAGAYVIGTATSQSGAKKIDEQLKEKGAGRVLNVTDANDVKNIIDEISSKIGIDDKSLNRFGHNIAKIDINSIDGLEAKPDGNLILVTAISPTPAGEGKTTTSVGLSDALNLIG